MKNIVLSHKVERDNLLKDTIDWEGGKPQMIVVGGGKKDTPSHN